MRRIALILALTALAAPLCAQDADAQFWPDLQVVVGVHPKVNVTGVASLRLADGMTQPFQGRLSGGLSFALNRNFIFAPGFHYIVNDPENVARSIERRLTFDFFARTPAWHHLSFSDRNRFEARHIASDWTFRYRNRLQLELDLRAGNRSLVPYGAAELFYDRHLHSWNRVRYVAGVKIGVAEHVGLEPYYLQQRDGHTSPSVVHAAGLTVSLRFRTYRS